MRRVKFSFEGTPTFDGFAHGTEWNGFDNVSVTPEERDRIAAYFETGGDRDTAEALREHPVEANGLVDLSGGYVTTIEPFRAEQITPHMREDLAALSPEWTDTSWGNDTCDSYENDEVGLKVWFDYVLPKHREIEDAKRFTVCTLREHGECEYPAILETEDWSEVVDFLKLQHANAVSPR